MKKLKKLELKDTPKMQDLQSEEMKHFQGGYMLDEVTVYGYSNNGSYHVGYSDYCKKCNLMNPQRFKKLSQSDVREGLPGYTWGVDLLHWLTKKR